jgi:hypothetical protein
VKKVGRVWRSGALGKCLKDGKWMVNGCLKDGKWMVNGW